MLAYHASCATFDLSIPFVGVIGQIMGLRK